MSDNEDISRKRLERVLARLYLEPLYYFDLSDRQLFCDVIGNHFFWDEAKDAMGPFQSEIEARYELLRYYQKLHHDIEIPEFLVIKPLLADLEEIEAMGEKEVITDEKTLKERLQNIISLITNEATKEMDSADPRRLVGKYKALGYGNSAKFACEMIVDEFKEFWPGDEDEDEIKLLYVEPITYINDNKNIFYDAIYQYFFWDEVQCGYMGPFQTEFEAKYEMFRYGQGLEDVDIPAFSIIKSFFDKIVEDQL